MSLGDRQKKGTCQQRIDAAIGIAVDCGGFDGDDHKAWVIDQMVQELCVDDAAYQALVARVCDGEDGPCTYTWEQGIPP